MSEPERPVERPSKLPDFTPFIVLVAILGILLVGLYLFPMFKTMMVYQDCVASGRVDCTRK